MQLLYISNEYPPDTGLGGIGTYTKHAAEGMAARGHAVHVICRSISGSDTSSVERGVTIHRVVPGPFPLPAGRLFFPFRKICYRFIPESLVRLAWAKSVYLACKKLIGRGCRFDLIEYPECGGEGYYLSLLNIPTVARLHTPWEIINRFDTLEEPFLDVKSQSRLERVSVNHATGVSSPTQALADRMTRRWHLRNVVVYPNPLPAAAYAQTKGNGWIYIGRVERRKGVHVLVTAYAAVCRDRSPPPLTLLGRPCGRAYTDAIRTQISGNNLYDRIRWIEGVSTAAVAGYAAAASAAFFPSLWENFPYACMEAMASGCAVVASRCGGLPEMVVDNESGLLVAAGDAEALAQAMKRLLDEKELASRLGEAARRQVRERYDQAVVCKQAEEFYMHVIRNGAHE